MNIRSFQKYAQEEKPEIKILKLWQDDYSNLIVSFELLGRKHAVLGKTPSGRGDWTLLYGIGAAKKTTDMPAGRGDYLVGNKMEAGLSTQLDEELSLQDVAIDFIKNKQGISWSPKSKTELENLSKLIQKSGEINSYLSEIGILYTGGDKLIYGEDITPEDILSWKIPEGKGIQIKELFAPQSARMGRSGNTPEVESFVKLLPQFFYRKFGRGLKIGSTFRSSLDQAKAMKYPLAAGDYDRLYGGIGPAAEQIKELISADRFEEAAKIIEGTPLTSRSHMAGRAIDIGFNSNGLKTSDYENFKNVVLEASRESGIPARLNSEKSTHFHIDVG
jgi:hypothetical protein